jgi:hypothetical protein
MSARQAATGTAAAGDARLTLAKEIKLPTAVLAMDAHPDGDHLFAACLDGGIYRVSIETGEHKQLGKHTSYASGAQYVASTNRLISAGYDGTLRWLHPEDGIQEREAAAHRFWSWKMRLSPDGKLVGTVTGQYMAGGYKYEPAPETEPSIKVFDAASGTLKWSLPHIPPVLSTAFSPDSRYLAAGNLMGEVRVYDLVSGKQAAAWTTPDFTGWGIIKSHLYVGGIFGMSFSPDGNRLLVCGMGPMIDPMAGNGKQTWQQFAWRENPPRKALQIADGDAGHGLMEVVKYHPNKPMFVMAGRLAQGKWNTAIFDSESGRALSSIDTKMRTTDAVWTHAGVRLALCGATSQERKKNGAYPEFGHIKIYSFES